MSVMYNFKINIVHREDINITSIDIIKSYLEAGWNLYSERNHIIYTDLGDNDDFSFVSNPISENGYFNIVMQKEKNNENIAFALFSSEENCLYRIDVIITPELEISISPDDGTKKMLAHNLDILDVSWYLYRVLPPLANKNILIEGFTYIQM